MSYVHPNLLDLSGQYIGYRPNGKDWSCRAKYEPAEPYGEANQTPYDSKDECNVDLTISQVDDLIGNNNIFITLDSAAVIEPSDITFSLYNLATSG